MSKRRELLIETTGAARALIVLEYPNGVMTLVPIDWTPTPPPQSRAHIVALADRAAACVAKA